ncbi:MAG: hypothetical protein V1856_02465 [Candidatus Liptonbacteria bacterium]
MRAILLIIVVALALAAGACGGGKVVQGPTAPSNPPGGSMGIRLLSVEVTQGIGCTGCPSEGEVSPDPDGIYWVTRPVSWGNWEGRVEIDIFNPKVVGRVVRYEVRNQHGTVEMTSRSPISETSGIGLGLTFGVAPWYDPRVPEDTPLIVTATFIEEGADLPTPNVVEVTLPFRFK